MGKDGIKWAQYQYEDDKPKCSKYSNRILHLERLPGTAYVQNINDPIRGENTLPNGFQLSLMSFFSAKCFKPIT